VLLLDNIGDMKEEEDKLLAAARVLSHDLKGALSSIVLKIDLAIKRIRYENSSTHKETTDDTLNIYLLLQKEAQSLFVHAEKIVSLIRCQHIHTTNQFIEEAEQQLLKPIDDFFLTLKRNYNSFSPEKGESLSFIMSFINIQLTALHLLHELNISGGVMQYRYSFSDSCRKCFRCFNQFVECS